jgi:hypothetical protein
MKTVNRECGRVVEETSISKAMVNLSDASKPARSSGKDRHVNESDRPFSQIWKSRRETFLAIDFPKSINQSGH